MDELNKIAAHSFGKAEMILQTINARLERMPEWKRYLFKLANFSIDRNILDEALVQKVDDEKNLFLYLKESCLQTMIRSGDLPIMMMSTVSMIR